MQRKRKSIRSLETVDAWVYSPLEEKASRSPAEESEEVGPVEGGAM